MGQYYIVIILEGPQNHEIDSWFFMHPMKLTEHSRLDNYGVQRIELFLTPGGVYHRKAVLWAGDNADPEANDAQRRNMSSIAHDSDKGRALDNFGSSREERRRAAHAYEEMELYLKNFPYVVNHTLREYVDKYADEDDSDALHPLPLLCCEGNEYGGYHGNDAHLVGRWARHEISVEKTPPAGFTKLKVNFLAS